MSRPAVFLDRDGVLVENVFYSESGEVEAPWRPEDLRLIPGAAGATRSLAAAGLPLVLISNQGAYAKGKTSLRNLWRVHERFVDLLRDEGVVLDAVFYSYSHPQGVVPHFSGPSLERKPNPYYLVLAAAQLDLNLGRSWFVGDRMSDVECARAVGVEPILVGSDIDAAHEPSLLTAPSILQACEHILAQQSESR